MDKDADFGIGEPLGIGMCRQGFPVRLIGPGDLLGKWGEGENRGEKKQQERAAE